MNTYMVVHVKGPYHFGSSLLCDMEAIHCENKLAVKTIPAKWRATWAFDTVKSSEMGAYSRVHVVGLFKS